jgi:hypothetical protein
MLPSYKIRLTYISLLLFGFATVNCKKWVSISPPETSISNANVYDNDNTAIAVQTGIYSNMMSPNSLTGGGIIDMSFYPALSADELTLWPGNNNQLYSAYYTNLLTNQNTSYADFWNAIYPMIYVTNSAIEGLNASTNLTPAIKQQLLGEAEFMRSFCYFYLVNLYGDVPLVLTSNYLINATVARTPQAQVWQQIINDLKSAQSLLSPQYLDGTLLNSSAGRLRPTKWAAIALLARAYLYTGQWSNAISEADSIINNNSLFSLDTLNGVFLASSTEAIWQLQPVVLGWNTPDAQIFIIPTTGVSTQWPVYLSTNLLNSFEPGDLRRSDWVDSIAIGANTYFYPYKYKINAYNASVTEYEMVLRLGEQYLIRAEAEAEMNDLSDAAIDVNTIRTRAQLPNLLNDIASSQSSLLAAIQHERQVELFTEWGNRWLDLKRTNTINAVMGSPGNAYQNKANGYWNPDWQLYPISLSQLQHDNYLVQNPGY